MKLLLTVWIGVLLFATPNILLCDTLSGVVCHCSRMLASEPNRIVWAFTPPWLSAVLWLKAYPQASAELPGQWTLTTFPLYAVRSSPHRYWHIYYYSLPRLILLCLFVSAAAINCTVMDCSRQGSQFNTHAVNNSPRIVFSWAAQNRLFRWDHIACFWHHIWCFCRALKCCIVFFCCFSCFVMNNAEKPNAMSQKKDISLTYEKYLRLFVCIIWWKLCGHPKTSPICTVIVAPKLCSIDLFLYQPLLTGEAFHKVLDAGCRDLFSFSRKSISEVGHRCWTIRPGSQPVQSIHPKGVEWGWGQGSV